MAARYEAGTTASGIPYFRCTDIVAELEEFVREKAIARLLTRRIGVTNDALRVTVLIDKGGGYTKAFITVWDVENGMSPTNAVFMIERSSWATTHSLRNIRFCLPNCLSAFSCIRPCVRSARTNFNCSKCDPPNWHRFGRVNSHRNFICLRITCRNLLATGCPLVCPLNSASKPLIRSLTIWCERVTASHSRLPNCARSGSSFSCNRLLRSPIMPRLIAFVLDATSRLLPPPHCIANAANPLFHHNPSTCPVF